MIELKKCFIGLVLLMVIGSFSCRKDEWDKHNQITDSSLQNNLLETIDAHPELSTFSEYLKQTGYDEVINSSKSFTVWAPSNAAFEKLDPTEVTDTAKLRLLIGNMIANRQYFTQNLASVKRIKALSGKNIEFTKATVNEANILTPDIRTKNGVLHIMDQVALPRQNAWELFSKEFAGTLQSKFIETLRYLQVNTDSAEQIGVDPETGEPIYKPGSGLEEKNRFLQRFNISNEDSLMTYFVLTDAAFQQEKNKLTAYFQDSTQLETDSLTKWNIVKDLVCQGVRDPNSLPPTLYSYNDSIRFHINKSDIIKTERVSNGIVYVLRHIDYDLNSKIKPVIIEGERFSNLMDPEVAYTIRKRRNPVTDSIFKDLLLENYGIASFWVRYPQVFHSVTYKAYWVAVNDFQTGTFPMKLAFKNHIDTTFAEPALITFDFELPYQTVELNSYSEVYLGEYTPGLYGLSDLYLIGNNVKANGSNTIVMDYIKLVPVLK